MPKDHKKVLELKQQLAAQGDEPNINTALEKLQGEFGFKDGVPTTVNQDGTVTASAGSVSATGFNEADAFVALYDAIKAAKKTPAPHEVTTRTVIEYDNDSPFGTERALRKEDFDG